MKCGILCDASASVEKSLWQKWIKAPALSIHHSDSWHIPILQLPYTWTELEQLPAKKAAKQWIRTANLLQSEGVQYLYLPQQCARLTDLHHTLRPHFEICDGKDVLLKTAHKIFEFWMKKEGAQPDSFELGIYRHSFDHQANNLLLSISENLKYVTLFCEDKTAAMIYGDNVSVQTGLCPTISDHFLQDHRRCSVVMLLDPPPSGCSFGEHQTVIDLADSWRGYCINTEIFTCPPDFLPIKQLFDGCDQRFAAFVLESCGRSVGVNSDMTEVLRELNLNLQSVAYVKRK